MVTRPMRILSLSNLSKTVLREPSARESRPCLFFGMLLLWEISAGLSFVRARVPSGGAQYTGIVINKVHVRGWIVNLKIERGIESIE